MSAEGHQRAKLRLGTDLNPLQVDLALLFILWDGAEVVGPMLGRTKPVLQFSAQIRCVGAKCPRECCGPLVRDRS